MPPKSAVCGLRRIDLISDDATATLEFYRALFDWTVLQSESGYDCWVGERRCAVLRTGGADERRGWRPIFAGAVAGDELTGPENTAVDVIKGRAQHGPWAPAPRRGELCWVELSTAVPEEADGFWSDALNWEVRNGRERAEYSVEGRAVAARAEPHTDDGSPGWLGFLGVTSLERAGEQVEELGGKVLRRLSHPGLGETLVVADPEGSVFALTGKVETWGG